MKSRITLILVLAVLLLTVGCVYRYEDPDVASTTTKIAYKVISASEKVMEVGEVKTLVFVYQESKQPGAWEQTIIFIDKEGKEVSIAELLKRNRTVFQPANLPEVNPPSTSPKSVSK